MIYLLFIPSPQLFDDFCIHPEKFPNSISSAHKKQVFSI